MTVYLVDFENVRSLGIMGVEKLNSDDKVVIFYSKNADSITFEAHKALTESLADIEIFMISKGGRNSLDFQLATYLGYLIMENKYKDIVIVSKDKGFLFAIEFWKENKEICNAEILIKESIDAHLSNEPSYDFLEEEVVGELSEKFEGEEITALMIDSKEDDEKDNDKKEEDKKKSKKKKVHKKTVATEIKLNIKDDVENLVSKKYGNKHVPMLVDVIEKTSTKEELYKMLVKKLGQEVGRDVYILIKGEYKNLKKRK